MIVPKKNRKIGFFSQLNRRCFFMTIRCQPKSSGINRKSEIIRQPESIDDPESTKQPELTEQPESIANPETAKEPNTKGCLRRPRVFTDSASYEHLENLGFSEVSRVFLPEKPIELITD